MYNIIIIVCAIIFILISSTGLINKTPVAMLGACVVMLIAAVADFPIQIVAINLNVILMLMGIMIIGDILANTGVFEWAAIASAKKLRGNGLLTVTALMFIAAGASALFSNPVTLVYLIPVTILLAQILDLPIRPLLAMQAFFANLGGSATLIGSPSNFIIGSHFNITFMQVFWNLMPLILVIGAIWIFLIWIFKWQIFAVPTGKREHIMKALPEKAITDAKTLKRALIPILLTLATLIFGARWISGNAGVVLLTGALLAGFICRFKVKSLLQKINWSVIMFYGSVCLLVGGLETGALFHNLGEYIYDYSGGNLMWLTLATLWGVAFLAIFIENIALTVLMLPLFQLLAPKFSHSGTHPLFWALMLGIMLGGCVSLYGASANFAMARLATRNRYKMSGVKFLAGGFPLVFIGLLVATAWLCLRYFVNK
ncbi:MAG: SLC13 family permease [Victivallaceae bacterium]|nr:SLC13 family permease [Victivallaceae bacterium]